MADSRDFPANMPPNAVHILIKNVYHPFDTQTAAFPAETTVLELKNWLQTHLATHPVPNQQKLICSGRICKDEQTLGEIAAVVGYRDDDPPVVFHLMLPGAAKTAAEPKNEAVKDEAKPQVVEEDIKPTTSTNPEMQASVPASAPTDDGKMPATLNSPPANYQMYMQLMLLQQQTMILAQIQYLQHLQAQLRASNASAAATTTPAPQHYQDPYQLPANFGAFARFGQTPPVAVPPVPVAANLPHLPGAAAVAAQANIAPAPAGLDAAAGAAAAPAAAVPVPNARLGRFQEVWALLDIRMALKMAFMLFILGQDLPKNRLILLTSMVVGVYLYFTGILTKLLELVRPRRRDAAVDGAEAAQRGVDRATLDNAARMLRISGERGFWKDVGSFLGGLFLSLAPAWRPQPVDEQGDAQAPLDDGMPDVDMANLQGI